MNKELFIAFVLSWKNWGKIIISLIFLFLIFSIIRPLNLPWWSEPLQILALGLIGGLIFTLLFNIALKNSRIIRLGLIIIFMIGFFIYLSLQLSLYYSLGSPMRDISIFDQAIWHLSNFQLPASSVREVSNLWGDHLNPIITLIVPFYWLKSDVRWLFILQALVVSLGVFPIYGIAYQKLKSAFAGLVFAAAYLFFIGVQHAINFGFYPETLSISFLAFMIYFYFKEKYWAFFLFLFLSLLCKENISLYIAFFGFWVLFFQKKRLIGLVTLLIGLAYFKFALWLIPHLGPGYIYFRYADFGQSPLAAIKTIFTKPILTLKLLLTKPKILTILDYLIPFSFLPIFSSFVFVLIPVFAEKFLSSDPKLWILGYHYGASAMPFLAIGSILAIAGFVSLNWLKRLVSPQQLIHFFSWIVLILTFINLVKTNGPLVKLVHAQSWQYQFPQNYQQVTQLIEKDKSLAAQMTLGTALAHRNELYLWPQGYGSDYILLSSKYANFPLSIESHKAKTRELLVDSNYGIRYSSGDIILFEKGLKNSIPLSGEMRAYLEE